MNKIRVIDLLNKIAKGEEVPNKIRYKNDIYIYYERLDDMFNYKTDDKRHRYLEENYYIENILNDEIEIIEEDKKIEELDVALLGQCDNWLQKRDVNIKSDFELNPYIIDNIRENTLYFQRKINELIDEINKLKGDKSEK